MGIVLFPDWLIGDRLKSGELIELLPELDRSIKRATAYRGNLSECPPPSAERAGDYRLLHRRVQVHRFTGSHR